MRVDKNVILQLWLEHRNISTVVRESGALDKEVRKVVAEWRAEEAKKMASTPPKERKKQAPRKRRVSKKVMHGDKCCAISVGSYDYTCMDCCLEAISDRHPIQQRAEHWRLMPSYIQSEILTMSGEGGLGWNDWRANTTAHGRR